MTSNLNNAELFLISAIFGIYLFVLVLRLILAYTKANYFNPMTQFVVKMTQPLVAPIRRIIPNWHNIEFATLIWIIIFEMLKFFLLSLLTIGIPSIISLFVLAIMDIIKLILNTFFYAIFLGAILSWIQPGHSPIGQLLDQITSPIMRPLRRLIPPIGGFDITPIPALIILQFLIILLP